MTVAFLVQKCIMYLSANGLLESGTVFDTDMQFFAQQLQAAEDAGNWLGACVLRDALCGLLLEVFL